MIEESIESLSPLETFDKNTFIGDAKFDQNLCNFILTLSLIWNDTKNVLLFIEEITEIKCKKNKIITRIEDTPIEPFWGEISGLETYLEKSLIALIHELFELVRDSKAVIESPIFLSIKKKMTKEFRESWNSVEASAYGMGDKKQPLGKALMMVRNKIANHYDKKEIQKGYRRKFIDGDLTPYVSRGKNMAAKRYYFSDAAAQEYYRLTHAGVNDVEYYTHINLIKSDIRKGIQNLVDTFIQMRSSWRRVEVDR